MKATVRHASTFVIDTRRTTSEAVDRALLDRQILEVRLNRLQPCAVNYLLTLAAKALQICRILEPAAQRRRGLAFVCHLLFPFEV